MIRVEAVWLATTPLDMRAGTETALARVVQVFGGARPHHAYLFANRSATRMRCSCTTASACGWQRAGCIEDGSSGLEKVLANKWPLTQAQLQALVLGLPWQRIEEDGAIRLL